MESRPDGTPAATRMSGVRALLWVMAALLISITAGLGYAYAVTSQESQLIPRGVSVAGIPVGGLTPSSALPLVEEDVDHRLSTVLVVYHGEEQWTVPIADVVRVLATESLAAAERVRLEQSAETVLRHDLLGEPIERDVIHDYTIDGDALAQIVEGIGEVLDTLPQEPDMYVENGSLTIIPARAGLTVDRYATEQLIRSAAGTVMQSPARSERDVSFETEIEVVANTVAPENGDDALSDTVILVNLTGKRLTLYRGGEQYRSWPVATGTPGHPTPAGEFTITQKRYMPTWGNPGSAWAADMPASIPPGPSNPLGVRALNLNIPGIRIHGTSNIASLGTAASHGCVRMSNSSVVELYNLVEVGTPVYMFR